MTASGPLKGRVDVPGDRACFLQHLLEGLAVGEVGDGAVEGELGQFLEEAVAEEGCEDADRSEEVGGPRLPRSGVDIEAAVGNEAVDVGMPLHLLVPGVEHGGAADVSGEASGIGADGLDGVGGTMEQDVEHGLSVLEGDLCDGPGQGEDDVEVGQDMGRLPRRLRRGALGAVTVSARRHGSAGALVEVTAEFRRAAGCDAVKHLARERVQPSRVGDAEAGRGE